jgi:hypothetical protein
LGAPTGPVSKIPYRYAGDKLTGQKVEKLLQGLIMSEVLIPDICQGADWPVTRLHLSSVHEETALQQAVQMVAADTPIDTITKDWDPQPDKHRKFTMSNKWVQGARNRLDTIRSQPALPLMMQVPPTQELPKEQGDDEDVQVVSSLCYWMKLSGPNSKMHLSAELQGRVPLCRVRSGKPFCPFACGEGIDSLVSHGRPVCDLCFLALPTKTKEMITQAMKSLVVATKKLNSDDT